MLTINWVKGLYPKLLYVKGRVYCVSTTSSCNVLIVFSLSTLFISTQLHTPTSAAVHLVLEVAQSFWVVSTALEMSKHFWTAATTPGTILTTILMVVMLECGVNTDNTQVTLDSSWYVTAWNIKSPPNKHTQNCIGCYYGNSSISSSTVWDLLTPISMNGAGWTVCQECISYKKYKLKSCKP